MTVWHYRTRPATSQRTSTRARLAPLLSGLLLPLFLLAPPRVAVAETEMEESAPAPESDRRYQADPALAEEDQQEYEEIQTSLEGKSAAEAIRILQTYLKTHPTSPNAPALEAQLSSLMGSTLSFETLVNGGRGFSEPMGFSSAETYQHLETRFQLGLPPWVDAGLSYQHPLNARYSLTGTLGGTEGASLVLVGGRMALQNDPALPQRLTVDVDLRTELSSDTRFQVEPRVHYARAFKKLELQAFVGTRVRLNQVRVRALAGLSVAYPFSDRLMGGLEISGYLKPVLGLRTDLPTSVLELTSFFHLSANAQYLVDRHWSVSGALTTPVWSRFVYPYAVALTGQVTYRFGT